MTGARKFITPLILLLLLFALVTVAAAQEVELTVETTANLNLRDRPDLASLILDTIPEGTALTLQARSADGNWAFAEYEGQPGWVRVLFLVAERRDILALPIAVQKEVADPSSVELVDAALTTVNPVNLRAAPTTEAAILDSIPPLITLEVLGRTRDNSWLVVELNEQLGWVSADYIQIAGDLLEVNVLEAGQIEEGLEEPALPEDGVINTQVIGRLNLRSGPGARFEVLDTVPANQRLALRARNADGTWALTDYLDQSGWVDTTFVTADPSQIMLLPIANRAGQIIEGVAAITETNLNLRAGPGEDSFILVTMPEGSAVPILGRSQDESWLLVAYQAQLGWAAAEFVEVLGDLDDVAVMDEAG